MKDFCGRVGLEEYFCFPGAEQARRFSKLVDNELGGGGDSVCSIRA